jgi:hypothetical protein
MHFYSMAIGASQHLLKFYLIKLILIFLFTLDQFRNDELSYFLFTLQCVALRP